MINEFAFSQFKKVWELFDKKVFELGGSSFLIDPFKPYFPLKYPLELTREKAELSLHEGLFEWGFLAQAKPELITIGEIPLKSGEVYKFQIPKNPRIAKSRQFIFYAFFNICCLAIHKQTLEELIFEAYYKFPDEQYLLSREKAFTKLVGISNSFLLTGWTYNILFQAISIEDKVFFRNLSKAINKNIPYERFNSARTWLGTTLLWYLGGKDMKRRDFMLFLSKEKILSPQMEELSFNVMISKLKLKKDLLITKTD